MKFFNWGLILFMIGWKFEFVGKEDMVRFDNVLYVFVDIGLVGSVWVIIIEGMLELFIDVGKL